MKSITSIISLLLLSASSFSQSINFTIEGKLSPKHDGKFLKMFYEDAKVKKTDSVQVNKGTFKFSGQLMAPTIAQLSFTNQNEDDFRDLFLAEGRVKVVTTDSLYHAVISGTPLAEEYEVLAKELRPGNDLIYKGIPIIKKMPDGEEKKAYVTKWLAHLNEHAGIKKQKIHEFVKKYPASYVSLYTLDQLHSRMVNYEELYPIYTSLSSVLKDSALGKQLGERLLASKSELIDKAFIDFISFTPDGKQLSLKEVISKNKYTLVDFWASWCGPCRHENPNVVKTYNAFKNKGFTVLSVSLDDNRAKWEEAIIKDGMPWYHVSSLKGWKEPAAALYKVRAIPQNVLIDQSGKVVATNLREEVLYQKVQALLP